MLSAFKIKPFDLEPVLAEWTDGPVFKGSRKKDPPVEEWLEQIKEGCVERKIPEEYWYRVAQHFMGKKAKARFEEVKQVVSTVNGGNYKWTWKKFKVAMVNMGWEIDPKATETIKVQGRMSSLWFNRKKTEDKEKASEDTPPPPPPKETKSKPSRSNTLRLTKKPVTEEPEEISTPGVIAASRPPPKRSMTLAETFFGRKDSSQSDLSVAEPEKDKKATRPAHPKSKSEVSVTKRPRSESWTEVARPTQDSSHEVSTVTQAPVWLLNACNALDFLTSEHPKAMSVISAVLITVGSIPSLPAISAGAGGTILASGAAHAIGAIAVGIGQALGSSVKNTQGQGEQGHSGHH